MNCRNLPRARPMRVEMGHFYTLHPEGRRLITGWFNRAWGARECSPEDSFEPFIFSWFAVNGWAACVTGEDGDKAYVNALGAAPKICQAFDKLLADTTSSFAQAVSAFADLWPIFQVKTLPDKGLDRFTTLAEREALVARYLPIRGVRYEPACWKSHRDVGEKVPVNWQHTVAAIYQVRCNLFHGMKAAHSEMDQQIVVHAFRILVYFFREAGYL